MGMPEKSILLSKLEREMLTNPKGLDNRQKRNLNYRLKTKCAQIDQALHEIKLLIDNVPEASIRESVSNKTLDNLMAIFENILQVLDPWPIGVTEDGEGVMASRVFGNAIPSAAPGKCAIFSVSRTATVEESELDFHLTNFFNKIRFYVDPCTPDPVCRNPEYLRILNERFFKKGHEFEKPFLLSESSYLDEKRFNETGWLEVEPSIVDMAQLPWMRWKPRELKECTEQPPILRERKITRAPDLMLTLHHDKEGETYTLIEKGEKKVLTKEEYLEALKKFKIQRTEETNP